MRHKHGEEKKKKSGFGIIEPQEKHVYAKGSVWGKKPRKPGLRLHYQAKAFRLV